MKVLLLTGCYLPGCKGGGPIKTISNLVNNTSDQIQYSIITSDRDLGDDRPYEKISINQWNKVGYCDVFYTSPDFLGLKKILSLVFSSDCDVIYLNSFFSLRYSFIPLIISIIRKKPIVIGPRGEFSLGALALKAFKKKLFISLFKLFNLQNKLVFQASSSFEQYDIKRVLGENTLTFIAENIASQKFSKNIVNKTPDITRIVSLSRISPIKNLKFSLEILKKIKNNIVFDIYGPLEDKSYWHECQNIINQVPKNIQVNYKGTLDPSSVIDTLSNYDLFLMPTQGENYGHVIVEALCAGLPILIADTTPWRDLNKKGIGWDISLNQSEKFIDIIHSISNMPVEEHYILRKHVLSWAENKFSQRDNITQNIAMFRYAFENK